MAPQTNGPLDGIAIAGAGPVAQAFGKALRGCGIRIACVASRDLSHAKAAAAAIGGNPVVVPYSEVVLYASHALVAVADRAITPVAQELANGDGVLRVALHTCGNYGPEVLAPLRARGTSCGGIHPLQTIRHGSRGADVLEGCAFAVSGDPDACSWAEQIATALNGQVLRIRPEFRPLYHAAAVLTSNYVAALLDSAERLMVCAGVGKDDALRALGPLARTTIDNIFRDGPAGALTGPIARADAATVAEHTRALLRADNTIAELYRAAGMCALRMACEWGVSREEADGIRQALLGPG
jgi:predicted short-subunit dehydrogenase-like oxidoreductase (DUF2520 family)